MVASYPWRLSWATVSFLFYYFFVGSMLHLASSWLMRRHASCFVLTWTFSVVAFPPFSRRLPHTYTKPPLLGMNDMRRSYPHLRLFDSNILCTRFSLVFSCIWFEVFFLKEEKSCVGNGVSCFNSIYLRSYRFFCTKRCHVMHIEWNYLRA